MQPLLSAVLNPQNSEFITPVGNCATNLLAHRVVRPQGLCHSNRVGPHS